MSRRHQLQAFRGFHPGGEFFFPNTKFLGCSLGNHADGAPTEKTDGSVAKRRAGQPNAKLEEWVKATVAACPPSVLR